MTVILPFPARRFAPLGASPNAPGVAQPPDYVCCYDQLHPSYQEHEGHDRPQLIEQEQGGDYHPQRGQVHASEDGRHGADGGEDLSDVGRLHEDDAGEESGNKP